MGQLGNGSSEFGGCYCVFTPAQVLNLSGASGIAAGLNHSVALKSDSTAVAWGSGWQGQLGNGTRDGSSIPVPVGGLNGLTSIAAGGGLSLALRSDGTVWAWGDDGHGQLGWNWYAYRSLIPVQANTSRVTSIAAGYFHSLAVQSTIAPAITINPANQVAQPGGVVSFTAAANGSPTPTVQWQMSVDGGSSWAPIADATTTMLTFTATAGQNANQYRAIFTNVAGAATSGTASLSVLVASPDRYALQQKTTLIVDNIAQPGVLANDIPAGARVQLLSGPSHGALTQSLTMTGMFTYTPDRNFVGTDSFTYAAQFANVTSNPTSVTLFVVGPDLSCVGCDLSALKLSGDTISNANLSQANLASANLQGAILTDTNLTSANLSKANLNRADLTRANLKGAVLSLATLDGVVWNSTTCPDGTNSKDDGGTCLAHL